MSTVWKTLVKKKKLHFWISYILIGCTVAPIAKGWCQTDLTGYSGSKSALGDKPKSNIVKIYNSWVASKKENAMLFWPDHLTTFGKWSGTLAGYSSFFGYYAGEKTTGYYNSFFGQYSGRNTTTGTKNSFFGYYSGNRNTTGFDNSLFGYFTGYSITTGNTNILIGNYAGYSLTNQSRNVAIGYYAGNRFRSTGNVAIGFRSGERNTGSGGNNTFIGNNSGYLNTGGTSNVFIGYRSGESSSGGSRNVFIGANSGFNETSSDRLYIDNSTTSAPLIWGNFSTNHLRVNGRLETTGNLQLNPDGYIDDDATFGGEADDWIRLRGYIEMKSNTDSYGIVLRNRDASDYLAMTQVDGSSYLTESSVYTNYFIKGTNRDTYFGNHIYGKSVNASYSNLYRFGGIFFTWDSDSYGTNTQHSIRSTYGDTYGDHITLNSYGNIRFNIDANANGSNAFEIGKETTHTSNILLKLQENGNLGLGKTSPAYRLDVAGTVNASAFYLNGQPFDPGEDIWLLSGANTYYNAGNVGIGTATPSETLHVNGAVRGNQSGALRISTGQGYVDIGPQDLQAVQFNTDRAKFYFQRGLTIDEGLLSSNDEDLQLQTEGTTRLRISRATGNVGIGLDPRADYKLAVEGHIGAREVNVNRDTWPDYVFEEGYDLPSLEDTQSFIEQNGHLPNMPSAGEVVEHGIDLGEMDARLLEQVEQLTLHTIAQEKELKAKETRISELESRLERLEQMIQGLRER